MSGILVSGSMAGILFFILAALFQPKTLIGYGVITAIVVIIFLAAIEQEAVDREEAGEWGDYDDLLYKD